MNLLITGGAGFIGINFINYMFRKYNDVKIVCMDCLTYASQYDNVKALFSSPRFTFEKVDICDRNKVYGVFEKNIFDAVVNFAAESHVDNSINAPEIFFKTNILGTTVLLDAVNKYGIRRFHQISTDEIYGDLPLDQTHLCFTEDMPLKPSSPYSASKASADMLCLAYNRTYGTPVTVSRCSNNYGFYQNHEKLIPKIIKNACNSEKIPLYGDGLNVRDWIYVTDHCKAVDAILTKGKIGSIYNIGGNCEISNIDLTKRILAILGCSEDLIRYVPDRKGHDRRYAVCTDKITKELGWKPESVFSEKLDETVRWYKEQNNNAHSSKLAEQHIQTGNQT